MADESSKPRDQPRGGGAGKVCAGWRWGEGLAAGPGRGSGWGQPASRMTCLTMCCASCESVCGRGAGGTSGTAATDDVPCTRPEAGLSHPLGDAVRTLITCRTALLNTATAASATSWLAEATAPKPSGQMKTSETEGKMCGQPGASGSSACRARAATRGGVGVGAGGGPLTRSRRGHASGRSVRRACKHLHLHSMTQSDQGVGAGGRTPTGRRHAYACARRRGQTPARPSTCAAPGASKKLGASLECELSGGW